MVQYEGHAIHYSDALMEAMTSSDSEAARRLLSGIEVSEVADCEGFTLLHLSALCGNAQVTDLLIKAGCEVDAEDSCGCTALLLAARAGHARVVNVLLDAEASFCGVNRAGIGPLNAAAARGDMDVVNAFTLALADLGFDDKALAALLVAVGWPLHYAVKLARPGVTRRMLDTGARVNEQDALGKTALHRAVARGDEHQVRLLLEHGADVNLKDKEGAAPLHSMALCSRRANILGSLLGAGARPQDMDVAGKMQCQYILKFGVVEAVGALLHYGLDLDIRDDHGEGPLHYAAYNADPGGLHLLLAGHPDLEARDRAGRTALHCAASTGNLGAVHLFLEDGANPNARDRDGRTPLTYAVQGSSRVWQERRRDIVHLLLEFGATESILSLVVEQGKDAVTQVVLRRLACLEGQGGELSESERRVIDGNESLGNYYRSCKAELRFMQEHQVIGDISFFDVLVETTEEVSAYVAYEPFVSRFLEVDLIEFFPEYSEILQERFNKALKRIEVPEKTAKIENRALSINSERSDYNGLRSFSAEFDDFPQMNLTV